MTRMPPGRKMGDVAALVPYGHVTGQSETNVRYMRLDVALARFVSMTTYSRISMKEEAFASAHGFRGHWLLCSWTCVSDTVQHPGRKQVVDKMAHFMLHRKQKEEAGDRIYSAMVSQAGAKPPTSLGGMTSHPNYSRYNT